MKRHFFTLVLFVLVFQTYGQNMEFQFLERKTPAIKKEQITNSAFLIDIMPGIWNYVNLPYQERIELDLLINYFPQRAVNRVFRFISADLTIISNGVSSSFRMTNEILTSEQKNRLISADLGTEITVKFNFKHKEGFDISDNNLNYQPRVGVYKVAVVPHLEAEYPGGNNELSRYLNEKVIAKIDENNWLERRSPDGLKFLVSNQGEVVQAEVIGKFADPEISALYLDCLQKMPKWKPAKDQNGKPVNQQFVIPVLGIGC